MKTTGEVPQKVDDLRNGGQWRAARSGIWTVGWSAKTAEPLVSTQAALFRDFFCGMTTLLDVEEAPEEVPDLVRPIESLRGVGRICTLAPGADLTLLMEWLSRQSWLAIAYPGSAPAQTHLVWKIERLFSDPTKVRAFLRDVGASRLIVTYYDGEEWLLAIDG